MSVVGPGTPLRRSSSGVRVDPFTQSDLQGRITALVFDRCAFSGVNMTYDQESNA